MTAIQIKVKTSTPPSAKRVMEAIAALDWAQTNLGVDTAIIYDDHIVYVDMMKNAVTQLFDKYGPTGFQAGKNK